MEMNKEQQKKIRTRRAQKNNGRGNLSIEVIRIQRRGEERCDNKNEGEEEYEGGEIIFRRTRKNNLHKLMFILSAYRR
jgi:hypothetical protein